MQLRKHHWKLVRNEKPCRLCGNAEHAARDCSLFTKRGKSKLLSVDTSFIHRPTLESAYTAEQKKLEEIRLNEQMQRVRENRHNPHVAREQAGTRAGLWRTLYGSVVQKLTVLIA